jgi:Protein of unknown function (DUF2891)
MPTPTPLALYLALLLAGCAPGVPVDEESQPSDGGGSDGGSTTGDTGGDTGGNTGGDTGGDPDSDAKWEAFLDGREEALVALAEPILACVARDDTSQAAFDGCIDWHSAVHGHWALFTLTRLLDDPSYAEAAEVQLVEADLAIELERIEANALGEVPYGYAWFLLLALERERMGETDLSALGEAAANGLDAHIAGLNPTQATYAALADEYSNLSWAVLNLWRWAEAQGDTEMQVRMEAAARDLLLPLDAECPLDEDITDTDNFFPACLMRAHALLTVLPQDEADEWLAGVLPSPYPITPITNIDSAHTSGLNFSRTWGLWSIYLSTGDVAWRDAVREHLDWHLQHPEYWAENYLYYSHWVPQFGVYAIAQTVE